MDTQTPSHTPGPSDPYREVGMDHPELLWNARPYRIGDCGCSVDATSSGTVAIPARINYCPTHAAAPEMLAMLRAVDRADTYMHERGEALARVRTFLATLDRAQGKERLV